MTETESALPEKKKRVDLQQNEEASAPVTTKATGNQHKTTIRDLNNDILGISQSFLGGGHFRYGPLACKTLLGSYLASVSDKKITKGESITSTISCAQQYFEDVGTGTDQLVFFWFNAARYGRVEVMEWAHQQGYSRIWKDVEVDVYNICREAAEYGQLDALKWLKANGCGWNSYTCHVAAAGGHLSCLQWARDNGCDWDSWTCFHAAAGGHLSVLKWARENGCESYSGTCTAAAGSGHLSILQWARENGCDWDIWTFNAAEHCGNPDVLNYAIDQGCPRD